MSISGQRGVSTDSEGFNPPINGTDFHGGSAVGINVQSQVNIMALVMLLLLWENLFIRLLLLLVYSEMQQKLNELFFAISHEEMLN